MTNTNTNTNTNITQNVTELILFVNCPHCNDEIIIFKNSIKN